METTTQFAEIIIPLLVTIGLIVVLFVLFREFVMWYWKINERIKLQREQLEISKRILSRLSGELTDQEKAENFDKLAGGS